MQNYNVQLIGQQSHIKTITFENQTESQVKEIIEKYFDEDYTIPQLDGNSYEINNDYYFIATEI
jgi:hypothetical protein